MDRILRAEPGWQEAIAGALRVVSRPIATDPRLTPRRVAAVTDGPGRPPGEPGTVRSDQAIARRAATLLLLYPAPDGELAIPLTVRRADLRTHAGEVSLPGGAVDPVDPSPQAAALREAEEEIGLSPASVQLLGSLDEIWIPVSNFRLRTVVGAADPAPELAPQAGEVAAIVELPVRSLIEETSLVEELIEGPGFRVRAGAYRHAEHVIWGATARALAMFASVLRGIAG